MVCLYALLVSTVSSRFDFSNRYSVPVQLVLKLEVSLCAELEEVRVFEVSSCESLSFVLPSAAASKDALLSVCLIRASVHAKLVFSLLSGIVIAVFALDQDV